MIGEIIFAVLIVSSLFFSLSFLWGITHLLKFKEKNFKKAAITILLQNLALIIIALIGIALYFLSSNQTVLSMFIIIDLLLSPAIQIYFIRCFYKEDWKKSIIAGIICSILEWIALTVVVMFIGIILWQTGILDSESGYIMENWKNIEPVSDTIKYEANGEFKVFFFNYDDKITINRITIQDYSGAFECNITGIEKTQVEHNDPFEVKALCPAENPEYPFSLSINIDYSTKKDGAYIDLTESGTIKRKPINTTNT